MSGVSPQWPFARQFCFIPNPHHIFWGRVVSSFLYLGIHSILHPCFGETQIIWWQSATFYTLWLWCGCDVDYWHARILGVSSHYVNMIHNKIHLIRPGCLRPSIALTVQNRGLKHQSFIHHVNQSIAARDVDSLSSRIYFPSWLTYGSTQGQNSLSAVMYDINITGTTNKSLGTCIRVHARNKMPYDGTS